VKPLTAGGKPDANTVVPLLFDKMFPDWFTGIAFAAIGIGALVPAAIMSIAAANLFTRNIYREYLKPDATHAEEARVSKLASLVVKAGAVAVILLLDTQFSIDLQLIGGVIIVQTLPAIVIGLYSRAAHAYGLLAGLIAGLASGLYMLYKTPNLVTGKEHFGGAQYALSHFGLDTKVTLYTGVIALVVNLLVTFIVTAFVRGRQLPDQTEPGDYELEAGDPGVEPLELESDEAATTPAPSAR
jgi:SSS family solute:Na+ symporter